MLRLLNAREYIRKAKVWHKTDISKMNVLAGPQNGLASVPEQENSVYLSRTARRNHRISAPNSNASYRMVRLCELNIVAGKRCQKLRAHAFYGHLDFTQMKSIQ